MERFKELAKEVGLKPETVADLVNHLHANALMDIRKLFAEQLVIQDFMDNEDMDYLNGVMGANASHINGCESYDGDNLAWEMGTEETIAEEEAFNKIQERNDRQVRGKWSSSNGEDAIEATGR